MTQRYSAALLPQSNDCRSSASAGLRTRSQPRAFHYPMLIPGPWLSLPRADQPARLTSNTSPGSPSRYSLCVGVSPAAESKREREGRTPKINSSCLLHFLRVGKTAICYKAVSSREPRGVSVLAFLLSLSLPLFLLLSNGIDWRFIRSRERALIINVRIHRVPHSF